MDDKFFERLARQLRIAFIVNQYKQGNLAEDDALELLAGPLTPGDEATVFDDSALLHDPDALDKITAQYS